MPASVSWPGRARRALAEQAERLRQSLDSLGQQLREGIAGEIARAVAAAVCEAVRAALDCRPADQFRRPYTRPVRPSAAWDDPRESEWSDGPDDEPLRDEWDGGRWDEPEDLPDRSSAPPAHRPPEPGRGSEALLLLWQGLLWWLRGRGWWTALGTGLLAAAAAFAGNSLLASVAGVAAAVSGLVALSDSAESGAAALSEAVEPE
jgi:hypothetical protein